MSDLIKNVLLNQGNGCILVNKGLVRNIGLNAAIVYSAIVDKHNGLSTIG